MNKELQKLLKSKVAEQKKKSTLVAVRLPSDIMNTIDELQKSTGSNQSQIIIEALRKALN